MSVSPSSVTAIWKSSSAFCPSAVGALAPTVAVRGGGKCPKVVIVLGGLREFRALRVE